jgi:hypothetical protein
MSKARDIASATPAPSTVSATELGYLDGVSSAIQTQIDSKIGSASAINPTIVDAKGDIIAATAADTVARLAVGSNDQVLTADSSTATGLKWATASSGGMTLLNSGNTAFSGVQTITFSSIPSTYKHLYVVGMGIRTTASYGANIQLRFNGDTAGNYRTSRYNLVNSTLNGEENMNAVTNACSVSEVNNNSGYNEVVFFELSIPLYANTTQYKRIQMFSSSKQSSSVFQNQLAGAWNSTSAIDSLTFYTSNSSTGNFTGDGAIYIYGVN